MLTRPALLLLLALAGCTLPPLPQQEPTDLWQACWDYQCYGYACSSLHARTADLLVLNPDVLAFTLDGTVTTYRRSDGYDWSRNECSPVVRAEAP